MVHLKIKVIVFLCVINQYFKNNRINRASIIYFCQVFSVSQQIRQSVPGHVDPFFYVFGSCISWLCFQSQPSLHNVDIPPRWSVPKMDPRLQPKFKSIQGIM